MASEAFGAVHEDYGGRIDEVAGRPIARRYRRPARTHRAVRNGVGVIELPYDVLRLTGGRRLPALDAAVTNRVPGAEGAGCYAFVLEDGRIAADLYAYNAGERALAFVAPGRGDVLAEALAEEPSVDVTPATDEVAVFGVHGPQATEKVASVLNRTGTPEDRYSFVRGRIADVGVSVVRTDAPAGETGHEIVCAAEERDTVFDTLLNRGLNAVPLGWETWLGLTLEAGTPVYPPDLAGRSPGAVGVGAAYPDGEPPATAGDEDRLFGVTVEAPADAIDPGTSLRTVEGETVGVVTRAVESPMLDRTIGFAVGPPTFERGRLAAGSASVTVRASRLPFHAGSERSGRCPRSPAG